MESTLEDLYTRRTGQNASTTASAASAPRQPVASSLRIRFNIWVSLLRWSIAAFCLVIAAAACAAVSSNDVCANTRAQLMLRTWIGIVVGRIAIGAFLRYLMWRFWDVTETADAQSSIIFFAVRLEFLFVMMSVVITTVGFLFTWSESSTVCSGTTLLKFATALVILLYLNFIGPVVIAIAVRCGMAFGCSCCIRLVQRVSSLGLTPPPAQMPATGAQIRALPETKFTPGMFAEGQDVCVICVEQYRPGEAIRILPCGTAAAPHHFHKAEVDQWLKTNSTCPICRQSMLADPPPPAPAATAAAPHPPAATAASASSSTAAAAAAGTGSIAASTPSNASSAAAAALSPSSSGGSVVAAGVGGGDGSAVSIAVSGASSSSSSSSGGTANGRPADSSSSSSSSSADAGAASAATEPIITPEEEAAYLAEVQPTSLTGLMETAIVGNERVAIRRAILSAVRAEAEAIEREAIAAAAAEAAAAATVAAEAEAAAAQRKSQLVLDDGSSSTSAPPSLSTPLSLAGAITAGDGDGDADGDSETTHNPVVVLVSPALMATAGASTAAAAAILGTPRTASQGSSSGAPSTPLLSASGPHEAVFLIPAPASARRPSLNGGSHAGSLTLPSVSPTPSLASPSGIDLIATTAAASTSSRTGTPLKSGGYQRRNSGNGIRSGPSSSLSSPAPGGAAAPVERTLFAPVHVLAHQQHQLHQLHQHQQRHSTADGMESALSASHVLPSTASSVVVDVGRILPAPGNNNDDALDDSSKAPSRFSAASVALGDGSGTAANRDGASSSSAGRDGAVPGSVLP